MSDEEAPPAAPGWFATADGRERYWDGVRWTDAYREAQGDHDGAAPAPYEGRSPGWFLAAGAIAVAVGAFMSFLADGSGTPVMVIGGVLLVIGVIAAGVRSGR